MLLTAGRGEELREVQGMYLKISERTVQCGSGLERARRSPREPEEQRLEMRVGVFTWNNGRYRRCTSKQCCAGQ